MGSIRMCWFCLLRFVSVRCLSFRFRLLRFAGCGLLLLLLYSFGNSCYSQTFSEWFSQSKTQKKYLVEQIAALQVYLDAAKKGYRSVSSGLETVRGITSGELGLHEAFFKGLRLVSPVVKGDARVAEILVLQVEILRSFSALKNTSGLDALGLSYVASVSGLVISDCLSDLEELAGVVLSSSLELSDDERLLRLESVYERMVDRASFVQKFCSEVRLGVANKKMEVLSIESLRRYHGIN